MANSVEIPAVPTLPTAGLEYRRKTSTDTNNVLRLFFNRLVNGINKLAETDAGGSLLYFPHMVAHHTAAVAAGGADTATVVPFNTVDESLELSVESSSQLTFTKDGVFKICGILQAGTSGSTADTITVWLRKNGTDVVGTAHQQLIQGSSAVPFSWGISVSADDYIQVVFAVSSTDISLTTTALSSPYPAIHPAIAVVDFVSNG